MRTRPPPRWRSWSAPARRAVGVSNHAPARVELLQSRLSVPLVTNQVELSLMQPAALFDGTLDHAQARRMAPMAWSPLGGGSLFAHSTPQAQRAAPALTNVGRRLGADEGTVALAWLLRLPSRPVPVLGSCHLDRLRNLVHAEGLKLERQTWFELLEASTGREVP